MQITQEILRAAYNYLLETPPFNEWNLPDAEDVEFVVVKTDELHGLCAKPEKDRKFFTMGLSENKHKHTTSVMITMAHEMVHMHLSKIKYRGWRNHGDAFKKVAKEVCEYHGFDPGQF